MLSSAMPSAKPGLRPFVTACLERAGAVLEEAGFELVEALLPEELYHLQDQDHLLLAFDYEVARENPEAIFLTYGSPLLDSLARLAASYGRYTVLYGPEAGFKQAAWLEREIAEKIEFVRCRPPRVVHQWLEGHVFRGFFFRAVFRSHEKTEELLEIVVDESTGLVAPDFAGWWANVVAAGEPRLAVAGSTRPSPGGPVPGGLPGSGKAGQGAGLCPSGAGEGPAGPGNGQGDRVLHPDDPGNRT